MPVSLTLADCQDPRPPSPEEMEVIRKKMKVLDLLLTDREGQKGKYKIEVRFAKARSSWKPTPGIVSWWESGKRFHGGGDEKVYLCPGRRLEANDCERPILDLGDTPNAKICAHCGTSWKKEDVIGELLYNLTMQNWAHVIVSHYLLFGQDADIVLKHSNDDLRSIALREASFRRSEALDITRSKRAVHIYPLRNIIKDVSNGSDLYKRIYVFLTA